MQFYIAKSYKNKYEQQERALQNKGGVVLTPWPPPPAKPLVTCPPFLFKLFKSPFSICYKNSSRLLLLAMQM